MMDKMNIVHIVSFSFDFRLYNSLWITHCHLFSK